MRTLVAAALGVALVAVNPKGTAFGGSDEISVPINLQAKLLARVVEYDRNFVRRAGDRAHVLLLERGGDPDSARVVAQMRTELSRINLIGGLPHDEPILAYTTPSDLTEFCKTRRISIVYLAPAFRDELSEIRDALSNLDILSVASVGAYVVGGIVIGFDVVSSRPRMIVNLSQSRLQHVNFTSDALSLMTVIP